MVFLLRQYLFTSVGLDQQSLQWFRYILPDRLAIDLESRLHKINDPSKKTQKRKDKLGTVKKKRRSKTKEKGSQSINFVKFSTNSYKPIKSTKKKSKSKSKPKNDPEKPEVKTNELEKKEEK